MDEAGRILALLTVYHREDLVCALVRAVRYRAFSSSAVEHILGAQAKPRSVMETLVIDAREQLDDILHQTPISTRPTADYQLLLLEKTVDEQSNEDQDHGPEDSTA
jgi:hypothetical protein